jgi:hypothetical protein
MLASCHRIPTLLKSVSQPARQTEVAVMSDTSTGDSKDTVCLLCLLKRCQPLQYGASHLCYCESAASLLRPACCGVLSLCRIHHACIHIHHTSSSQADEATLLTLLQQPKAQNLEWV